MARFLWSKVRSNFERGGAARGPLGLYRTQHAFAACSCTCSSHPLPCPSHHILSSLGPSTSEPSLTFSGIPSERRWTLRAEVEWMRDAGSQVRIHKVGRVALAFRGCCASALNTSTMADADAVDTGCRCHQVNFSFYNSALLSSDLAPIWQKLTRLAVLRSRCSLHTPLDQKSMSVNAKGRSSAR